MKGLRPQSLEFLDLWILTGEEGRHIFDMRETVVQVRCQGRILGDIEITVICENEKSLETVIGD
jgi:hypothetical protein